MRAFVEARSVTLRRWAVLCLSIVAAALLVGWATGPRDRPAAASSSQLRIHLAALPAVPAPVSRPEPTKPRAPVLTMLHGMGMSPSWTCERVTGVRALGFELFCPTGNVDYGDGTADWAGKGEEKARHLDRAFDAATIDPSAEGGDVLMGFSRGAFVARDVAYARKDRWRGLVLIGAALIPDAELLRASGVRRVVLASGDHDGAKKTMVAARAKLCAAGMPARFVSLGPVWHALPPDSIARMKEALAWASGEGEDEAPGCSGPRG